MEHGPGLRCLASVEWNRLRRSWSFIAATAFTLAVLVLRLGSVEDRIVVGAFWLSLVFLPVERYVHQLAGLMARVESLRYVLLSTIALIWAWASVRLRGGGGPFHIQIAGIWRGYPFPFEEWWWSQGGLSVITWWRDVHWFGLIGDLILPAVAFLVVLRWLRRSGAPAEGTRALLLVVFTIAFTWLNIEPWIGGVSLTLDIPPPPFQPRYMHFAATLTAGFPLIFWNGFSSEPQFRLLATDVAIGLTAWIGLYAARPLALRLK